MSRSKAYIYSIKYLRYFMDKYNDEDFIIFTKKEIRDYLKECIIDCLVYKKIVKNKRLIHRKRINKAKKGS